MSDTSSPETATAGVTEELVSRPPRLCLVVVDDTQEWRSALRYACRWAVRTGGRVALLRVIEPIEFQHWMAVEQQMREEQRGEAEQLLHRVAQDVIDWTGTRPALYVREGQVGEQLTALIDEEQPLLSLLVLAASSSSEGPGPLVNYLMGRRVGRLPVPVTVVPGILEDDALDRLL